MIKNSSSHLHHIESSTSKRTDKMTMTGFDEYMNIVLDEAEEYYVKKKTRRNVGKVLLKGDNITLIMNTGQA